VVFGIVVIGCNESWAYFSDEWELRL